jgi:class 3 adenylate cyclase
MATLLVADVERFTRLWENPPDEVTAAVTRFEQTVSEVVAAYGGVQPAELGVGFARRAQPAACPGWHW